MTARARAKTGAKSVDAGTQPEVFYRIDSLLRVMRAIEQHEEQMCAILHEIRRSGALSADLEVELRDLLEQMPSFEYHDDLIAVRETLSLAPPQTRRATPESRGKVRGRKAR